MGQNNKKDLMDVACGREGTDSSGSL